MQISLETKNKIFKDYLHQLDSFEIELTKQEQEDFDELNKILQYSHNQENLST